MAVLVNNMQDRLPASAGLLSLLENIGNYVLRMEGRHEDCEVSIILVDNIYIKELNYTYRGRDSATDVLAFNLQDGPDDIGEDLILGDVVISLEKAREQAENFGHTLKREVAFLAAHGILHLLGYDHETAEKETEMKEKQELVLKKYKL